MRNFVRHVEISRAALLNAGADTQQERVGNLREVLYEVVSPASSPSDKLGYPASRPNVGFRLRVEFLCEPWQERVLFDNKTKELCSITCVKLQKCLKLLAGLIFVVSGCHFKVV